MRGLTTLWLPGYNHAGASTQSIVEKMIWRYKGKTRHDLGRPKLTEKVWGWKEKYHANISNALRCMGCSFDWTKEAFTIEERKKSKLPGNVIDPLDVISSITLQVLHKLIIGNLNTKDLETAMRFQETSFLNSIPECGDSCLYTRNRSIGL